MTTVDWLIVGLTVLLASYGFLRGFIVGALSLAGFAIGAFLGGRFGPLLLPSGPHSPYAPLFGLIGALLAGGVLASGLEGVGIRARSILRVPGLRTVDGLLGAGLTACVGLGVAWIVGAVAVQSSGSTQLRADIQRSAILRELNRCCRHRARFSTRSPASIRCRRCMARPRMCQHRGAESSARRPCGLRAPASSG